MRVSRRTADANEYMAARREASDMQSTRREAHDPGGSGGCNDAKRVSAVPR